MAIKICLDAGHYGKYNRSPAVPAYYESDMNWKLHLLLKAELEQYGIEVITTRERQEADKGLKERGKCSAGCDLFLSIHSNASENENVDYPLAIVPISGEGDALGMKLTDCVRDVMDTTQVGRIWTRKSDKGYDWYGVIRGAAQVGVTGIILEHSFHTNLQTANWLLNDRNLAKLAAAEAKVIAEYYGVSKKEESASVLYRVQVGAYSVKANAEAMLLKLRADGYEGFIVESEGKAAAAPVPEQPTKKSVDEIAREVINGKWGNGDERKQKLIAAGYDYKTIQKRVNELVRG